MVVGAAVVGVVVVLVAVVVVAAAVAVVVVVVVAASVVDGERTTTGRIQRCHFRCPSHRCWPWQDLPVVDARVTVAASAVLMFANSSNAATTSVPHASRGIARFWHAIWFGPAVWEAQEGGVNQGVVGGQGTPEKGENLGFLLLPDWHARCEADCSLPTELQACHRVRRVNRLTACKVCRLWPCNCFHSPNRTRVKGLFLGLYDLPYFSRLLQMPPVVNPPPPYRCRLLPARPPRCAHS